MELMAIAHGGSSLTGHTAELHRYHQLATQPSSSNYFKTRGSYPPACALERYFETGSGREFARRHFRHSCAPPPSPM